MEEMEVNRELRSKTMIVRMKPKEIKKIKSLAGRAGLSLSDYVRRNSLAESKEVPDSKEFIAMQSEFIFQIQKIGVNINQIVKSYHSYCFTPTDKEKLLQNLEEIKSMMEQQLNRLQDMERS